ncbi:MAG: hypothetical protein JXB47_03845 [Anaerolineae bacterium]|nr:hypothetical protein [Anaerolineae bacterium]
MRISQWLTVGAALVTLAVVIAAGALLLQPPLPLITEAKVAHDAITPNADGDDDATQISYRLAREAVVSIYFEDTAGNRFYFRRARTRTRGDYGVLFGGVVEGFTLPGETVHGVVEARLLPDGAYTWTVEAVPPAGEPQRVSGALAIRDGDPALPDLIEFTISPSDFTPNQDGIADRVQINVYLPKPATLSLYLEGPDDERIYIPEREEGRKPGEEGRHVFDYEGGVDQNADPPPDGTYTVIAVAEDDEGQRVTRTGTLTITLGGKPLAEIVAQPVGGSVLYDTAPYDVRYEASAGRPGALVDIPEGVAATVETLTLPAGDMLVFKLTVWNYTKVPLRTSGPPPGTVYQQDQRASTLGWLEESGAWRVGLDCDTAASDYPWRWAIGAPGDLIEMEHEGKTYYYLPSGAQAVVWGAVRLTDISDARNPQECWAGLIHEDVEIATLNNRVDPHWVRLVEQ